MPSLRIRELAQHMLVYGLGSVGQSLVGLLLIPLFARYLSTSDFGAYSLITLCGTLFAAIFYFGVTSALPRSFFDYQDREKQNEIFSTSFYLILVGATIQVVIGFFARKQIAQFLFGSVEFEYTIFVALLGSAFTFINYLFLTYMRLKRQSILVVVLNLSVLIINFLSVYILIVRFDYGLEAPVYMGALIQALMFFVCVVYYTGKIIVFKFDFDEARLQLRFGVPTMLASIAGISIVWSDRLFINQFLTLSEVGVYSMAYRVSSVVNVLFVTPFSQIWNPMMIEYREKKGIELFFRDVTFYYVVCGLILLCGLSLFAVDFMGFISNGKYLASAIYIPAMSFGILIYGLSNITSAGFFYERKMNRLSYIYFATAALSLILNYLLIPKLGLWGAVSGSLIIYLLTPFIIYFYAYRLFSFGFDWARIFLAIGAVVVVGFCFYDMIFEYAGGKIYLKIPIFLVMLMFFGLLVANKVLGGRKSLLPVG